MIDVFINLLASLIWFLLGVLAIKFNQYINFVYPLKRLWKFKDPKNFVVCIANSTITDTGSYYRPATGIGQVRAVATLTVSLKNAYNQTHIDHIYMSTDQLHKEIENDLIIIGGVKNNIIGEHYLKLLKNKQPLQMTGNEIVWKENNDHTEKYIGKTEDKKVIYDYGIIMRTNNPFSSRNKRTTVFIAGSHTYGTIAASRYFTENLVDNKNLLKCDNFIVLIGCNIINSQATNINKIKEYSWKNEDN